MAKLSVRERLSAYTDDWDGCGASAPSEALIAGTEVLVEKIKVRGWRDPDDLYPLQNGHIVVEWQTGQTRAELVIDRIIVEFEDIGLWMSSYLDTEPVFGAIAWFDALSLEVKPEDESRDPVDYEEGSPYRIETDMRTKALNAEVDRRLKVRESAV